MAFLTGIANLLKNPGGLWEWLILRVFKFIGNYGWRILFFTVCLKLLLLPLDLYQRIKMRKNQRISERIAPQMEKLQQQYAGDKQALAQKQMELNRKEGFSYFSSCLPALVTLVIFFYLFAGLNNISQYKIFKQYVELYDAYKAVETVEKDKPYAIDMDGDGAVERTVSWNILGEELEALGDGEENSDRKAALQREQRWLYSKYILPVAQQDVLEKYTGTGKYKGKGTKESFLWVNNIWSPDVPWRNSILSYNKFRSNISGYKSYNKVCKKCKVKKADLLYDDFVAMMNKDMYDNVTGGLRNSKKHNRANGFLILPILSVALSFLSQFITSRLQKQSGQTPQGGMGGSMKMMMVIMPVMMGIFALTYTAMFTLYIVVNSATTILMNVITSLAMNTSSKHTEKKKFTGIQKYGRPDPKDL